MKYQRVVGSFVAHILACILVEGYRITAGRGMLWMAAIQNNDYVFEASSSSSIDGYPWTFD